MKRPVRQQLKGAFPLCRWCDGYGCMCCDQERRRHEEQMSRPIFTADRSDPQDLEALRRVIGREALEHAFGEGGGGVAEVEYNAAVESVLQALRKSRTGAEATPQAATSPTLAHVATEAGG